jgi:hypothetical protein
MAKKTKSAANRAYKDTVFRKLFSSDRKYLIEVYNAVFGAHYSDDTEVIIRTLKSVLRGGLKNDLAFELGKTLIVLIEHQSTISPNLPLRMLYYIVETYGEMIKNKALYHPEPVPLAYPVFVVFYVGAKPLEGGHLELRLSDLFIQHGAEPPKGALELVVQVYDINHGSNPAIEERSPIIAEYGEFVAISREFRKTMSDDEAIACTLEECIKRGILKEFLEEHKEEVMGMLKNEWSHDLELEAREDYGAERGAKQKALEIAKNLLDNGMDVDTTAKLTGLTIDDVLHLKSR